MTGKGEIIHQEKMTRKSLRKNNTAPSPNVLYIAHFKTQLKS